MASEAVPDPDEDAAETFGVRIVAITAEEARGRVVVAKTAAAPQGLCALFDAHDSDGVYVALTRGAPNPAWGKIEGNIARSTHDRKKMALVKTGGRHAVTHYRTERAFGPATK